MIKPGSHKAKLLQVYGSDITPLADEDAAADAGLPERSCFWKRCSELRQEGYIEWLKIEGVIHERRGLSGKWCGTSVITEKGRQALKDLR